MIELLQTLISERFTIDVLHEIVKKQTGWNNAVPKNIIIGGDTKKGESYLSVVTRFTIDVGQGNGEGVELRQVHVIAKGLPANIARRKTFRSADFFRNEIAFYTKVWPALEEFQKSKNLTKPLNVVPNYGDDNILLALTLCAEMNDFRHVVSIPGGYTYETNKKTVISNTYRCLATYCDGLHDFIVMEDLSHDGFSSMPRTTGLDFNGAVEILEIFGQFHALSFAFNNQKPSEFETVANSLEETYFTEKFRSWYSPITAKMCWILRDAVKKELPSEYLERLDALLEEDIYGEAIKECKDRSHLCGITHGDCWAPNFLIKCKDGKTETKIIDYQLARCASITTDLAVFLYVCVEPSIRESCWEELLKEYQRSFAAALKEYGSDESLISVELIKKSLRKIRHFTFAMVLEGIVMSGIDEEDVADLDSIQEETTIDKVWILKLITNPERRREVAGFFKHVFDHHFA